MSKVEPDKLTSGLRKGFVWTTQHSRIVLILVGLFMIGGVGGSIYKYMQDKHETAVQEKYYQIENEYLKKKEKFAQYEANAQRPKDKKASDAPMGEKASGDLQTDYGSVVEKLKELLIQSPNTRAAKMVALTLGEIYTKYNKAPELLMLFENLKDQNDLLSALVFFQKATVLANEQKCAEANEIWSKLVSAKSAAFLAPEIKLRMGLCYFNMKEISRAEQVWNEVVQENKDGQFARTAEKYLRRAKLTSKE